MSHFNHDFHPENGDLLYGKERTRKAYLDGWKNDWTADDCTMIDNLNNALHLDKVTSYHDREALRKLLETKTLEAQSSGKPRIPPYSEGLAQSRFSPLKKFDVDESALRKKGADTLERDPISGKLVPPTPDSLPSRDCARLGINRACTYGIAYVATNPELHNTNAKILYAIDDLDFEVICNKQAITRSRSDKVVPMGTSSAITTVVKTGAAQHEVKIAGHPLLAACRTSPCIFQANRRVAHGARLGDDAMD